MKKLKKVFLTTMALGLVMSQMFRAFAGNNVNFEIEYSNKNCYDIEHLEEYYDSESVAGDGAMYSEYKIASKCTEEEGNEILFDTDREINVTFAGNSLLGEPKVYKYFKELADRYELNVENVNYEIYYGQNLHYQLSVMDMDGYDFVKDEYMDSDVIIFQEYGYDYETTLEDIQTLLDQYCKEDVVAYYYTTQFDYRGEYLDEIANDERIHIIDFGAVFNELSDMYDEEPYLHKADYHPNELAGLMAAGYIFTQMYKTEFTDYQYSELTDDLKELIPGDDDTAKEEFYQKMIEVVNRGVTNRDDKGNDIVNQTSDVKQSEKESEAKTAQKKGDNAKIVMIALVVLLAGGAIAVKYVKRNSKKTE